MRWHYGTEEEPQYYELDGPIYILLLRNNSLYTYFDRMPYVCTELSIIWPDFFFLSPIGVERRFDDELEQGRPAEVGVCAECRRGQAENGKNITYKHVLLISVIIGGVCDN